MTVSRWAGWIAGFLLLLISAFAITASREGVGSDDARGASALPLAANAPAQARYLMDDAQREGARESR